MKTLVRITYSPNQWTSNTRPMPLLGEVIEGGVLHIGSTFIESGCQGAEFFAVPCLVIDAGDSIRHVPLREHARNVHVEKLGTVTGSAA